MKNYSLEQVTTRKQSREFLSLAERIYKDYPQWIHPIDNDINDIFNPQKNKLFTGGDAVRWLVRDTESGDVVGRIAAFYNSGQSAIEEQPTGGCGFFESIDSQQVADMLFDAAKEWLTGKGMEAMDGPINFGPRDDWWGLLIEGFDCRPLYKNPYNPPYYKQLFENYGFKVYFNQHTYSRELRAGLMGDTVYARVKRLNETPGYRFEHITKSDFATLPETFRTIYNKAWAKFPGVKPFSSEQTRKLFKSIRPIIDNKLIYLAHFNDQPIGFFIMVPDINCIIGRFKGRFGIVNKLRLLWLLRRHKADRIFGIIFAVTPEFQGKAIESGIICGFERDIVAGSLGGAYNSLELAWVGDFNPLMMRMVENYVCAKRLKMHTTYRLLFDPTKEFHRCPKMGVKKISNGEQGK